MTHEKPGTEMPIDQEKLQRVREFLRREFRGCQLRDYFEFDKTTQVFLIQTDQNVRHTLVIPRGTFRDAGFTRLLNQQLVTALKLRGSLRFTLTPQAPRSPSDRFLGWRRATDRARATLVRRPLVYGAVMLSLGFGACMLISSLAWEVRDPQPRVSGGRHVRTVMLSDQSQSPVPPSPVSGSVTGHTRLEERPAMVARRTASTERPAPRPPGRRDRNRSSNAATSVAGTHNPAKKPQADPVDGLRRLVGYLAEVQLGKVMVRWVETLPPADPEALRRQPEIPQSL